MNRQDGAARVPTQDRASTESQRAGAHRPRIAVLGGGAAGVLAVIHLMREAQRRTSPLDIVMVDPAPQLGRGVAYGTTDERHLLNAPAIGMSALADDLGHFERWLVSRGEASEGGVTVFAPRTRYAQYLTETWEASIAASAPSSPCGTTAPPRPGYAAAAAAAPS